MRKHADYVYRNDDDSLRVRVFRRENGRWDYDVFDPFRDMETFSVEAGDDFRTKREALAWASRTHGPLYPITVGDSVVDKAWYAKNMARRLS